MTSWRLAQCWRWAGSPASAAGIALIGYDDTDLAASVRPPLTTVHQPREELSLVTCERLMELIKIRRDGSGRGEARRTLLTPKLVIRETTGGADRK